jgi:tetratricopeptide (TPR) repeat protein
LVQLKPHPKARQAAAPPPVPSRKWLFRIAALLLMPLLTLAVLETALRLAGYGYSTGLFEKVRLQGRDYLLNNEKFSLRFFPPELSRAPDPLMIEPVKPAGTCRIFIFGESAAQGDPKPSFGAGRYLEVLLRERYPGVNFEVVNVGITAISSHVIVPIARECAHYQGDLWIIYMGNNEMIGPFGAATVFGAKAPPWPVVRLELALQTTRVGQLLLNLGRKLKGSTAAPRVWGGLEMFLGNQLATDDPRKNVVYKNFQRNLRDILRAGRNAGTPIILNTVAVNLKDCPPFASLNSSSLAPPDREKCGRLCAEGRGAEMSGDWKLAAADFGEAVALDPQMAEAQFRKGECLLRLNDAAAAGYFQKACDSDALAFRADSRINGIIREAGRQLGGPDLVLCDAAASLPEAGKIPGQETFYEHVHFNFDGNYRLALLWAAQAGRLLPGNVKTKAQGGWASQEVCEARLGLTDWNRCNVLDAVRRHMKGPPFNSQFNNERRVSELTARIDTMIRHRDAPAATNDARSLYTDAIARAPRDYMLHQNYGEFLELTGDLKQAALEWKQAGELMPRNPVAFLREGQSLAKQGELSSARESFRQALNLHPRYAEAWFELGTLAAMEGKQEEALENYRQSAALQPYNPQTYIFMGKALWLLNRTDESAQNFRHALELDGGNWEAHYGLGGALGLRGRIAEAKAEFQQVVLLQPQYAMGHLNLGVALLKLNDPEGARQQFAETLRLDPANKLARTYLAK